MRNFSSKTVPNDKTVFKTDNTNGLSATIKARRRSQGIKKHEMAKHMNIAVRTYSRKEAGNLSLEELQSICSYLKLKIIILPQELIE